MLPARAGDRLRLRADNAATLLTPKGIALELVRPATAALLAARQAERGRAEALLDAPVTTADYAAIGLALPGDGIARRRIDLLRYTEVTMMRRATIAPELEATDPATLSGQAGGAANAPYVARSEEPAD